MKKCKRKKIASFALAAVLSVSPAFAGAAHAGTETAGSETTESETAESEAAEAGTAGEVSRVWDFSDGAQGWEYDDSWAGDSYTGGGACSYDAEKGMLRLSLDFSLNTDNGYSQTGISYVEEGGLDYSPYKALNFDLYYDPEAFATGQLTVKAFANNIFRDQSCSVMQTFSEDVDGLKLVNLTLLCDTQYTQREQPEKLMLQIIGNHTDYHGYIYLDNITLSSVKKEKFLKETTVPVRTETALSTDSSRLMLNGTAVDFAGEVTLADPQADAGTVALYQYLKAVGEADGALYGHMEDTVLKAGAAELSESDTRDVTGSLSAIVGMDIGGLFNGFASKYNERHPGAEIPDDNAGNIRAAALFSNEAIADGAIITLSSHMPNFAWSEKLDGSFAHSYDGYDFSPADSYNLTGNCMNGILPGGKFHEAFRAHLDAVADYISQVEGTVLFRPLHENTGSWFWWGKAFCNEATYKNVFKYIVEYLRDERGLHNVLYLYGPGSEATSAAEYEERYPGDRYVDLIGFDTYDNNPVPDEEGYTFQTSFENSVKLTDAFAKDHGKLFAVTETGMSFTSSGGITEAGNRRPEWYSEILDIITKPEYDCCYFMLWSNYARSGGYYSPFVTEVRENGKLFGHELLDPFIEMYNNKKSIFAADQAEVLRQLQTSGAAKPTMKTDETMAGYITAPVHGMRLLEETKLGGRLTKEPQTAEFCIAGNGREERVAADVDGRRVSAVLTEEALKALGETAEGKVALYADGELLQEIDVLLNIAPRPDDPLLVDDFESYAGLASLVAASWSVNKDGSCSAAVSLSNEGTQDGGYALVFEYEETQNGWAGCEFAKEADWSDCDAVSFWVKPDGKNQKTVVQIKTASGGSYEAYLQEYPEYAAGTAPMLVTLPFGEFVDKSGRGALNKEEAGSIAGFSLWVNAIAGSEGFDDDGLVRGTLRYDDIKAVKAGVTAPVFEKLAAEEETADESMGDGSGAAAEAAGAEGAAVGAATDGIPAAKLAVPVISGILTLLFAACMLLLIIKGKKR